LPIRTNIEIDDGLMAEAQKGSGQANKKQTVEEALPDGQVASATEGRRCVRQIPLAREFGAKPQGASKGRGIG
jgi:hypothetical protein